MKQLICTAAITLLCYTLAFAQKADLIWANQISGNDHVNPVAVGVDHEGNILITGTFEGTADFDPGSGVFNLTSSGYWDIFLQKLTPEGKLIWAKKIGDKDSERPEGMEVDKNGNIYLTGTFSGTVDFDPGTGVRNLKAVGANDIFAAKYNALGHLVWAVSMGEDVSDDGISIAVDNEGSVIVTGYFQGTVDFDPGAGSYEMTSWGVDCFILKLSSSGTFVWAKMIGSKGWVEGHTVKTDEKNNIYLAGLFRMETDFNPGAGEYKMTPAVDLAAFLLKLDKNGNFRWAVQPGSTTINLNYGKKRPMAIDTKGNVILSFRFKGTVDFDPGAGQKNLTSNGENDIFIQKLDSLGKLLWVKQMGGTWDDEVMGIVTDEYDNISITGKFYGTVDFDPGESVFNMIAGDDWDNSMFVAKYDPNGNFLSGYSTLKEANTWPYGMGTDIAVTSDGYLVAIGEFSGNYDFNPGKTAVLLSSPEEKYAGYVLKLKSVVSSGSMDVSLKKVSVFPNPFTEKITVHSEIVLQNASVSLFSLNGQIIVSRNTLSGNKIDLFLPDIPAGIYVLEVNNQGYRYISKIVKM